MRAFVLLACALSVLEAHAGEAPPSDTEIAEHYFAAGRSAHAQERWAEAMEAFRAAARLTPRPELDYDVGLCLERLGRGDEAAQAFERFLAAHPDGAVAAELRAHVAQLHGAPRRSRTARAAIGVGVLTLALGISGAGLLGSAAADYASLRSECGQAGTCAPASYAGVREHDVAGKVLLGLAAAGLVVDVALVIAAVRSGRRPVGAPR